MSKERLTKQGIRNLNPVGHNGHKNHGAKCRHWFGGPRVVIGERWVSDPYSGYYDAYKEPIYGEKCAWCPEVRELR